MTERARKTWNVLPAAMVLLAAASLARAEPPFSLQPSGAETAAAVAGSPDIARPDDPATSATRPSAPSAGPAMRGQQLLVREWFDDLADTDPVVRERARFNLMGLRRDQLELLRQVVEDNRPLAPSQSEVLHDVVVHVYLTGAPYARSIAPRGFLGVLLGDVRRPAFFQIDDLDAGAAPPAEEADKDAAAAAPAKKQDEKSEHGEPPLFGVLINECVPGFCAFRHLQPGDLVMSVEVRPGEVTLTQVVMDLKQLVTDTVPGTSVTMQVLRQGKVIRVTFPVDPMPRAAEAGMLQTEQFRNARRDAGEEYWSKLFAPLLEGGMS